MYIIFLEIGISIAFSLPRCVDEKQGDFALGNMGQSSMTAYSNLPMTTERVHEADNDDASPKVVSLDWSPQFPFMCAPAAPFLFSLSASNCATLLLRVTNIVHRDDITLIAATKR